MPSQTAGHQRREVSADLRLLVARGRSLRRCRIPAGIRGTCSVGSAVAAMLALDPQFGTAACLGSIIARAQSWRSWSPWGGGRPANAGSEQARLHVVVLRLRPPPGAVGAHPIGIQPRRQRSGCDLPCFFGLPPTVGPPCRRRCSGDDCGPTLGTPGRRHAPQIPSPAQFA